MDNNKTTYRGVSFEGALTIAFIVLKLLGKITWKWIWVLAPIWIDILLAIILLIIYAIFN